MSAERVSLHEDEYLLQAIPVAGEFSLESPMSPHSLSVAGTDSSEIWSDTQGAKLAIPEEEKSARQAEMREREQIILSVVQAYGGHHKVAAAANAWRDSSRMEPSDSATSDYLEEINHYPLLDAAQERMFLQALDEAVALYKSLERFDSAALTPDQQAIFIDATIAYQRLYLSNLRLVVSLAKKYIGLSELPLLDLIHEGNIGLSKGIRRILPRLGNKVSTVAYNWIRQGISRQIIETGYTLGLPVHVQTDVYTFKRVQTELEQQLGYDPSDEEIADASGKDLEEVAKLRALAARSVASLNVHSKDENENSAEVGDLIPAPDSDIELEKNIDQSDDALWLQQAFDRAGLNDRERLALALRYGLLDGRELKLEEIGKEMKISRERVRQIQRGAFLKIRSTSESPHD